MSPPRSGMNTPPPDPVGSHWTMFASTLDRLPASWTTNVISEVLSVLDPTLRAMKEQQASQTLLQAREMVAAENKIKALEKDLAKAQENIARLEREVPNTPQWLLSTANRLGNQNSPSGEVLDKKELEKVLAEMCKHKFSMLKEMEKDIQGLHKNAQLLQAKYEKYAAAIENQKSQVKQEPVDKPTRNASRNVSADSVVPSDEDNAKPNIEALAVQDVGHEANGSMDIDADTPMPSIEDDAETNINDSEMRDGKNGHKSSGKWRIVKMEHTSDS